MGPRPLARCLALCCLALAVMGQGGELFQQPPTTTLTHRGAEDDSFDMMIDYQALVESQKPAGEEQADEDTDPTLSGEGRAAKDPPPRVDLSRPLEEGWRMDPVLLQRRQAGEPLRPDDDVTPQTFGIELRKEF